MTLFVTASEIDVDAALKQIALDQMQRISDGSGASHFGGPSGWIFGLDMLRVNARLIPALRLAVLELRQHVQTGALVQTMVNRLRPGGELKPHRDGPPDLLRFHLPLATNRESYWWDSLNGRVHMREACWYGPVPYCGILHGAANMGSTERIHVVCDFERREEQCD